MGSAISIATRSASHLLAQIHNLPPAHLITLTSLTTSLALTTYHYGYSSSLQSIRQWMRWTYRLGLSSTLQYYSIQIAKRLPWTKRQIDLQVGKQREEMISGAEKEWNDLLDDSAKDAQNRHLVLPTNGKGQEQLLSLMTEWSNSERKCWDKGQASGAIYHGEKEIIELLSKVYGLFAVTNPLHPDLFPYVRKMEGEIVAMMIHLFHGKTARDSSISVDDNDEIHRSSNGESNHESTSNKRICNNESTAVVGDCCGTLTSGGTESILLACKSYRDRAQHLYNITSPEIIAPTTIHAAFEKAAHYFGMRLIHVDIDEETGMAKVEDVKRAITSNTVLIAASAPNFPHGIIDPIEELALLAFERNIGFHSDCCLGGMMLPFVDKLQQGGKLDDIVIDGGTNDALPIFDFRAKGVTSISADMHKYGYAPKGSSVVLYSSSELRHYQYFVSVDWTGGIYASPTLAGSRPGGISAATWAVMVHLGKEGYLEISERIIRTARSIKRGIRDGIEGIEVIGNPLSSVVAFRSTVPSVNIYGIGQGMAQKGWNLNSLQYPSCLHICCTNLHCGKDEQFLRDLREAVEEVTSHPEKYAHGSAAVYGMVHAIPDATLMEPIAKGFVDALFMA